MKTPIAYELRSSISQLLVRARLSKFFDNCFAALIHGAKWVVYS